MLKRRAAEHVDEAVPHGAGRVLVVNDDVDACELLCRIVAEAGHEVDRARDHIEAIGHVTMVPSDCAVLDLSIGGIGANLKLLDAIRSHHDPRVANCRVVLVAKESNNQMFSWQSGVDAFLLRPFHADELVRLIHDVLSRPDDQRARHRRTQLNEAETGGRRP